MNNINHVVFVLDASGSMQTRAEATIKAFDGQIAYLAERSSSLDQETRVSVFTFDTGVSCLVYDKDVLRLPSIAASYRPQGMTALIDAVCLAIDDIALTPTKYGEHAFLMYVLTDGAENASKRFKASNLLTRIGTLPENWTVACLVPDQVGVFEAKKFGFPIDNITIWDTTTVRGMEQAVRVIRDTTDGFMTRRAQGIVGTKNLFRMDASHLNTQTVASNMTQLPGASYRILDVPIDAVIKNFVEQHLGAYVRGNAYYQITKPEDVQVYKQICVQDRATGLVYGGAQGRKLLGLPDYDVRVAPADWSQYVIFVQSTSANRRLIGGTRLLVLL